MLQHMDPLRKSEGIDPKQLCVIRVGAEHRHPGHMPENVFILALRRLNHQKMDPHRIQLTQNFIDRITLP